MHFISSDTTDYYYYPCVILYSNLGKKELNTLHFVHVIQFWLCFVVIPRGSALERRRKEREKEEDSDNRDRRREREEIEDIKRRLMEEGGEDLDAEIEKVRSLIYTIRIGCCRWKYVVIFILKINEMICSVKGFGSWNTFWIWILFGKLWNLIF